MPHPAPTGHRQTAEDDASGYRHSGDGYVQRRPWLGLLVSVMEEHEYSEYAIPDPYEKDKIEGIDILRFRTGCSLPSAAFKTARAFL